MLACRPLLSLSLRSLSFLSQCCLHSCPSSPLPQTVACTLVLLSHSFVPWPSLSPLVPKLYPFLSFLLLRCPILRPPFSCLTKRWKLPSPLSQISRFSFYPSLLNNNGRKICIRLSFLNLISLERLRNSSLKRRL